MKFQNNTRKYVIIHLFIIIYLSMFITGITETVKSITLPAIKLNFGVNYVQIGNLLSNIIFGYVLICIFATQLMKKIGIKKSLIFGYLILLTGFLLNIFSINFQITTIALIILTSAFGIFEVGNNALAMKIFIKRTALFLSFMHFFYGFGAIIGPFFGVEILKIPFVQSFGVSAWRFIYVFLSIPAIIMIIFISLAKFENVNKNPSNNINQNYNELSNKYSIIKIIKMRIVWIFAITLGLLVAVELSPSTWGPIYFKDVYNLNPEVEGAKFVSFFYILFTISRLFCGFFIEKIGYYNSLIISIISSILILTIGFSLGLKGIYILPISGIFISQFWILIFTITNKKFKEESDLIGGIIIALGSFINALLQILIGLINELTNGVWGFKFSIILASVALLLIIIEKKKILNQ